MVTGYNEKIGTSGNDDIRFNPNDAYFGGPGDDTYFTFYTNTTNNGYPVSIIPTYGPDDSVIMVGGTGNDSYALYPITGLAIISDEGSSTNDKLSITSSRLDNAIVGIIDSRHLIVISNSNTGNDFIIVDWLSPKNKIENFVFQEVDLTLAQLQARLPSLANYVGNTTYAQMGLSQAEINEINTALNEISVRASQIEGGIAPTPPAPPLPPAPNPNNTTGDDSANAIVGNDNANSLTALGGNDTVSGLGGNDLINGNQGNDLLNGNAGDDTVYGGKDFDTVYGGQGDDLVNGNLGNDLVNGNLGSDTVFGGQGHDTVYGGQGNDLIYGDLGDDFIYGNLGRDVLTGGDGADRFFFSMTDLQPANPGDAITDFVIGTDKIVLQTNGLLSAGNIEIVNVSGSTWIVTHSLNGAKETITSVMTSGSLTASDFIFS